jgi:DNA-binding CsgD family transcriptional regulator
MKATNRRPSGATIHRLEACGRAGSELTRQELAVLTMIAAGLDNNEIGRFLIIAPETVKWHVRRLLAKMPARNRAHAVGIAYRRGLFPGDEIACDSNSERSSTVYATREPA